MKKNNGDFQNYSRGRIDPGLKAIADSMSNQRGDPRSEYIAGLLRMKYSEIIGVPSQNWGAAYQGNAEQVRDNNGPLNTTDGNVTNEEYNTAFNQLRAEAELMLSGGLRPAAQPIQVAAQPVTQTAGVTTKRDTDTGSKAKGGLKTSITGPAKELVITKDITKIAPPKSNLAFTLRSDQMQALQQQREALIRQGRIAMLTQGGPIEKANARAKLNSDIKAHDIVIRSMAKKQAIDLLSNNNDPRLLNILLSRQSGQAVEYGPNNDGTWYEKVNGEITVPRMLLSNITSVQTNAADRAHYEALKKAKAESKAARYGKELDAALEIKVKAAEQRGQLVIEGIRGVKIEEVGDAIYMRDEFGALYQIVDGPSINEDGPPVPKLIMVDPRTAGLSAYRTGTS